jgi:hypothetical protein
MDRPTTLLVAAIAGALAGFGGGLVTGWVRPRPPAVKAVPAGDGALGDEVRGLGAQVAALEAEVARLRQQRRGAPAPAPPASAGAPHGHAIADDPVFEAAVRDVVDRVQQERAGEREERRVQVTQRWADRLAERLSLSDAQKAKALAIAEDLAQKLRDLRDADGGLGGGSWPEARDALRAQGEQRLGEVLSATQMATYRESSDLRIDAAARGGARRREQP